MSLDGKLRALVVDDERRIADTLCMILDHAGFHAQAAYNAEQALKQLEQFTPNLVITDVMMPGMNGVDLAIAIKQRHPECTILLCSGVASSVQLLDQAIRQGHRFTLLQKPIHPTELLRQVSAHLNNSGQVQH